MPKHARDPWLFHLKIKYDHTWDYKALCIDLCGSDLMDVLCVAEKLDENAHVHIQGQSVLSDNAFKEVRTKWKDTHYTLKPTPANPNPKCHPWKECKHEIDEKGYQYMSKEGRDPLYSNGFSDDQLAALKAASDAHVDELKNGLRNYLHTITYLGDAHKVYNHMREDGINWYMEQDKWPQPNRFKNDLLRAMITHPGVKPYWKDFVYEKMAPL